MRRLLVIVIVLGALWSGYWFVGRSALIGGVTDAFHNARAEGRVAHFGQIAVQGFPNRFDMSLTDVALGAPGGQVLWKSPTVQLIALSYRPNRMIAVLDGRQEVDLPDQKIGLSGQQIAANFNLAANPALSFDSLALIGDKLDLSSSAGWGATLTQGRVAANRLDKANTYRIGFEALDLTPNPALRAMIDPKGAMPATLAKLHLDGRLTLTAPLDRHAGESHPRPVALDLTDTSADWGQTHLSAAGKLTIGPDGTPEGRIDLTLTHWQPLIDMAVGAGWIEPGVAPTWRNMLDALAKGSGDPGKVHLPLSFQNGWMSFGPIPLGPAPRIALN